MPEDRPGIVNLPRHEPQPQRPGDSGPMSKGEFYAYCKRTGQLPLFFLQFPGG